MPPLNLNPRAVGPQIVRDDGSRKQQREQNAATIVQQIIEREAAQRQKNKDLLNKNTKSRRGTRGTQEPEGDVFTEMGQDPTFLGTIANALEAAGLSLKDVNVPAGNNGSSALLGFLKGFAGARANVRAQEDRRRSLKNDTEDRALKARLIESEIVKNERPNSTGTRTPAQEELDRVKAQKILFDIKQAEKGGGLNPLELARADNLKADTRNKIQEGKFAAQDRPGEVEKKDLGNEEARARIGAIGATTAGTRANTEKTKVDTQNAITQEGRDAAAFPAQQKGLELGNIGKDLENQGQVIGNRADQDANDRANALAPGKVEGQILNNLQTQVATEGQQIQNELDDLTLAQRQGKAPLDPLDQEAVARSEAGREFTEAQIGSMEQSTTRLNAEAERQARLDELKIQTMAKELGFIGKMTPLQEAQIKFILARADQINGVLGAGAVDPMNIMVNRHLANQLTNELDLPPEDANFLAHAAEVMDQDSFRKVLTDFQKIGSDNARGDGKVKEGVVAISKLNVDRATRQSSILQRKIASVGRKNLQDLIDTVSYFTNLSPENLAILSETELGFLSDSDIEKILRKTSPDGMVDPIAFQKLQSANARTRAEIAHFSASLKQNNEDANIWALRGVVPGETSIEDLDRKTQSEIGQIFIGRARDALRRDGVPLTIDNILLKVDDLTAPFGLRFEGDPDNPDYADEVISFHPDLFPLLQGKAKQDGVELGPRALRQQAAREVKTLVTESGLNPTAKKLESWIDTRMGELEREQAKPNNDKP